MAKKAQKEEKKTQDTNAIASAVQPSEKKLTEQEMLELIEKRLPPELKTRLDDSKESILKFHKKIIEKFDNYIVAVALLPPKKPAGLEEDERDLTPDEQKLKDEEEKKNYTVLVLIDDSDSKQMPKEELKSKMDSILNTLAKETDEKLKPYPLLLSELWTRCYDGRTEILQYLALSAPVYDKGMLAAIKIAEVHKRMVLDKFEKYIVSYVLVGSLVQGRATPESDIDVMIVIDDTDVKRMSRTELKDRLRTIIYQMSYEAQEITGIKKPFQIQTYILTDFWESIRDANPVIFTFLRDGIPFYDRGIFMPWKQLLRMGRIKPSQEAIDMYMSSGEQMLKRVQMKLNELGMEDFFLATIYPSQAAIMLYGLPPPTYRETPEIMRDIFVKKEKIFEEEYVQIIERLIKFRKDLEHGTKKDICGKEIDELLKDSNRYLERINKLFTQLHAKRDKESILHIYETALTVARDVLKEEGVKKLGEIDAVNLFEAEIVKKGLIHERYSRILKEIVASKNDFDKGLLNKIDMDKVRKDSNEFVKVLVEYLQRKRVKQIEHAKIRVKSLNKKGELFFFADNVFITIDVDNEREIQVAKFKDGEISDIKESTLEAFEESLAKKPLVRVAVTAKLLDSLEKFFGPNIEVAF